MPRRPRRWLPGAIYHLIERGNNRQPVFFRERDYLTYLRLLREARHRYDCTLLAYVLMTNHIHLMVQSSQRIPISKFMQAVGGTYAMYVNKRHKRVGHLFQGRFHSVLVESDSQALALSRYIHLNPVQAGLAAQPGDYRWSSYRAYLSTTPDDLVGTTFVLSLLSPQPEEQHVLYAQFVQTGSDPELENQAVLS